MREADTPPDRRSLVDAGRDAATAADRDEAGAGCIPAVAGKDVAQTAQEAWAQAWNIVPEGWPNAVFIPSDRNRGATRGEVVEVKFDQGASGYVQYLRRQSQDARAAAEHDRRIRVIRNQPRNPKARKYGRASVWNRSPAGNC
jgi:hypothetical protein